MSFFDKLEIDGDSLVVGIVAIVFILALFVGGLVKTASETERMKACATAHMSWIPVKEGSSDFKCVPSSG